jgi:hypothetical protein
MLLGDLAYVGRYGTNVAYWDEWDLAPVLSGSDPVTAQWLWAQHNEHRIALPKLIFLGMSQLMPANYRKVILYTDVLLLAGCAAALVSVARRLRGQAHWADAFFPLALLHWGHWENLLIAFQVDFVVSTALACVFLLLVARRARGPSGPTWLFGLGCVVALPLCGANGMAYMPPLALWLGYAAYVRGQSSGKAASYRLLVAALPAALAGLLVFLYFHGYQRPSHHPAPSSPWAVARTTLQFLGASLGVQVSPTWPRSSAGVTLLALASLLLLVRAWRTEPAQRVRVLGLLLFLAGVGALALGVGWARAWFGEGAGLWARYVTLALPLLLCAYLVWELYARGSIGRQVQNALCLIMVVFLWDNAMHGTMQGGALRNDMRQFEAELRAELPDRVVAERHVPMLYQNVDGLVQQMELMRKARLGPFAQLQATSGK